MKRGLWGAVILVCLLILCIGIHSGMGRIHYDISTLLEQAAAAAEQEDWKQAGRLARQAEELWQRHHNLTAALADHTPMDEVDGLFAELLVFLGNRESPHFQATCARLSLLSKAMADSHAGQWWNVL